MSKIKSKWIIAVAIVLLVIITAFVVYPNIEFKKDGKLYVCSYSGDFSEFEENAGYNELFFYNEKRDISIKTFDAKNFLFFYLLIFDYVEGDARETQFKMEEDFISYWIENAEIVDNEKNIDIAKLIEGKEVVSNDKRYLGNEYDKMIFYILDGVEEEMSVFESEGLTVIQVGSPDESPKYIAYK